jgi:hypothetical protein
MRHVTTHTKLATHWPHCEICGAPKAQCLTGEGLRTCREHFDGPPDRVPAFSWKTGEPLDSGEGAPA